MRSKTTDTIPDIGGLVDTREGRTTKETLHRLVDALPDANLITAREAIEPLADPFILALMDAPTDDELESDEERAAVAEAIEDLDHGLTRPWEAVRRELASE
jgi:hypothetical protein